MAIIKDYCLWEEGLRKILWAKRFMPILEQIRKDYINEKPLNGINVAISVHLEAKTANLALLLKDLGANVYVTGSNPLSTQDDIAAALVHEDIEVFAIRGATEEEYFYHLEKTLENDIRLIIDDGGDLTYLLHTKLENLSDKIMGGCEETTTGIIRLKALEKDGKLKFPMIAVNNAYCKHLFDNRYGTGQSTWDGIMRTTNITVAGKHVVVAGYGFCGKGIAKRAQGLGAKVIVTEVDPIKALEAYMDGFEVMKMEDAAKIGDIFVTATGCKDVVRYEHILEMKDGAILCNSGHFNVEIDIETLEKKAIKIYEARKNITGYKLENGKDVFVLAEGRLVNLAAADGHPIEIMDMSFAIQALCTIYVAQNYKNLDKKVYQVPSEIDSYVAMAKLKSLGIEIDRLTNEQKKYLNSWEV
ncbi:adenosylhomocysteinase [Caldicellulosiruptor saccharolyticus DSM 8903]|uniref:Adenosylhomocysteinase n=1 Tax=Caldicellulosiruptor saccharolyticus (strain ATCC 43494 / DSM 8903 / Tp8T 6331) TaxID=351627 RepID=A4XJI2_CALS8|nr:MULTISPECIES: adenosylhomocysteinase [Caldicellulosiruptor]ABP67067.2 adenosylhomocysteinase [Caldicellulosiruptor saccharolyticus DSM 8903]